MEHYTHEKLLLYGEYSSEAQTDPKGPQECSYRIFRGGSWDDPAGLCRSAIRVRDAPAYCGSNLGFRLARTDSLYSYTFTFEEEKVKESKKRVFEDYEVFRDGEDGPEMVYLPGGKFKMGSAKKPEVEWGKETPQHEVTLEHFAIGKYPVTVGEYLHFVEETGKHYPSWLQEGTEYHFATGKNDYYRRVGMNPENKKHPIVGISWEDAKAYCEWLTERTGETYSLPSEAEWEYACRAGSESAYCFGEDAKELGDYAWYDGNSERRTHPIGEKKPNTWGIYDMHGNVWEWVEDWYAQYPSGPQYNPKGPETGSYRIVRGGGWLYPARDCRSAVRDGSNPTNRSNYLGFRLARRIS